MITVDIDELTPCLVDNESGEIVETEAIRIKRRTFLEKYNETTGWYVNWANLLQENEIYALVLKGTVSIQGLVALRPDDNMKAVFVTWMVAAPHNNLQKCDKKRYTGVGGHLFAIATEKSLQYGFECAITGFAANKELVEHYSKAFNAELIGLLHPYQIFINEEDGRKIMEAYTYDKTDEII